MRGLLTIFVYIATAPIRWFGGAVARKDVLLRIRITFGWRRASVISECKDQAREGTYLMIAYLLFLSEYFYICDKRQRGRISDLVKKHIREAAPPDQLASVVLNAVRESLNNTERAAFAAQFKYPKTAPTYVEKEKEVDRIERIGRYAVTIYKRKGRWLNDLQISAGFDTVLLPITVGLLYDYVSGRIVVEDRALLDSCISELIEGMASTDGKSFRGAERIVNGIIARNLEVST